ncbi:signal peptidase I [Thermodesulfobacteriota bacterium]
MDFLKKIKKLIPNVITYKGTSMYPALRKSDILKINSAPKYPPSKGDIILFEHPENKNSVIHRIISTEAGRICTKGDNNRKPDAWVLKQEDVKGTVTQIWRNRKIIHILKGMNYHGQPEKYQALLNLTWPVYLYLRPVYKSNALKGIFFNLLPYRLKPRPVIFTSNNNVRLYLMINKTNVARYDRLNKKWFIKPPFRFIVSRECMDKARRDFEKHLLEKQNSG